MRSQPEGVLFEERQRLIMNPVVMFVLGIATAMGLADVLRLEAPTSVGLAILLLAVAMLAVFEWGRGGSRAYNIRGNRGVQLILENGQRILIGSQRSEELASAIQAAGFSGSPNPASPDRR